MRRAIRFSVITILCIASAAAADVQLPCGPERVAYWKAEQLFARSPELLGLCTSVQGYPVAYERPAGQTGKIVSEFPEVYFVNSITVQAGVPWLNLATPSGSNCAAHPEFTRVKLAGMTCRFR